MKGNSSQSQSRLWIVPAVLGLIFAFSILAPLVCMFFNIDKVSLQKVLDKGTLASVIGNSLLSATITTILSLILAYLLAWCTERTAMPCKGLFRILITLPMLIPSVSIGMGTVLLGGNNGILTNLLGLQGTFVYGLWGIVWGSVMYSLPVAYLMISNILKYEDSAPYEAARILGIGKGHQFVSITLPYLRKPMIAAAFSVFTLSFTDYGVPLMVGGKFKTLPMVMYQEVIGQLDFGKGSVYGVILLTPAIIAFLLDLVNKNNSNSSFVIRPFEPRRRRSRDMAALITTLVLTLVSLMPILSFVVLAFVKKYPTELSLTLDHFYGTMQMGGGKYLLNSVMIASCVSVFGVILCVLCAYFSARTKNAMSRLLHLVAMSTAAIPGVVLGLSYVLFFKITPFYGTLVLLVIVNIVHFFASPYLMIYTSFSKLNENLESVAATLGIGRLRLLKDVLLPACRQTVGEMLSYFFVNCMMTISAVSFLANTSNKPIALMINQFEAQAQMEAAAVVSLLILVVNVAVKGITSVLQSKETRRVS